jgi:hypothetical protein
LRPDCDQFLDDFLYLIDSYGIPDGIRTRVIAVKGRSKALWLSLHEDGCVRKKPLLPSQ